MASLVKNPYFESELFRQRALVAIVLVILSMSLLAAGYFMLQVVNFEDFQKQSESNRVKFKPTMPARGTNATSRPLGDARVIRSSVGTSGSGPRRTPYPAAGRSPTSLMRPGARARAR